MTDEQIEELLNRINLTFSKLRNIPLLQEVYIPQGATIHGITQDNKVVYLAPETSHNNQDLL